MKAPFSGLVNKEDPSPLPTNGEHSPHLSTFLCASATFPSNHLHTFQYNNTGVWVEGEEVKGHNTRHTCLQEAHGRIGLYVYMEGDPEKQESEILCSLS